MPTTDEGFYRRLVRHAAQAIISVDPQLRITSWNRSAEEIFGFHEPDILGKSIAILVPEAVWPRLERALRNTLDNGVVTAFDDDRAGPYGGEMSLTVTLGPIYDDEGHCEGVCALVRDVTRRKKLEVELAKAARLAGLGQLAGGVAHHFNNLLCGMSTRVEFAVESGDFRQMQRALRVAADAAGRMAEISRSLLIFACPADSDLSPVRLDDFIALFVTERRTGLESRKVTIETDLRPVPPVNVNVEQFRQVVHNLTANAAEALDGKPGRIKFTVRAENERVRLEVSDDGPGVGAEHIDRVFDPFYTSKGAYAGGVGSHAGLGLSVAHAVVNGLGGRIEVQSPPGKGATFIVSLPPAPPTT